MNDENSDCLELLEGLSPNYQKLANLRNKVEHFSLEEPDTGAWVYRCVFKALISAEDALVSSDFS